jgi:hypothetical protein
MANGVWHLKAAVISANQWLISGSWQWRIEHGIRQLWLIIGVKPNAYLAAARRK